MDYCSSLPYPPIAIQQKNMLYANAMLGNMGGANSEMSAVGSYFYNRLLTGQTAKEISDIFHHISIVEMHHLEIFGQLALQLGADPRLWAQQKNRKVYWSPAYVPYSRGIQEILKSSLAAEHEAIRKYERQTTIIKDMNIIENLERIIIDEKIHVEIFRELLQTTAP